MLAHGCVSGTSAKTVASFQVQHHYENWCSWWDSYDVGSLELLCFSSQACLWEHFSNIFVEYCLICKPWSGEIMRSSVVEKAFHNARGVHCCYVAHPQTNAPPREEWVRMTNIGKGYTRTVWAAEELGTGRSLGCHKVHRISKAARSRNHNEIELDIAASL